jgi:methyl-accepting chemotaxis protein
MNWIQNSKLAIKMALVNSLLAFFAISTAVMAVLQLQTISVNYAYITRSQLPSAQKLTAANRLAIEMVYAGYRAMAYDVGSKQARVAKFMARSTYQEAVTALDKAGTLNPSLLADTRSLHASLDKLAVSNNQAVELGTLNRKEEARAALFHVDQMVADFSDTIFTLNDTLSRDAEKNSVALQAAARRTLWIIIAMGAVGMFCTLIFGTYVSRYGIDLPIQRLTARMKSLAEGENEAGIPGYTRKDELGTMAKAAEVFRAAAIAKLEIEEAKVAAEIEQTRVVNLVADSLRRLAERDLTVQITEEVRPAYQRLKDDFNAATGELLAAMLQLDRSASGIATGSGRLSSHRAICRVERSGRQPVLRNRPRRWIKSHDR